ncbi:MAG: glycosyltransferase [Nitrospirae bacterium]|nr:glycosyltransferase [Nitrospirota bacterium]
MNRNILMLCYYFPPLTDVGSKRSVAFSKYFKKYGWNPYVLSVKNPDKGYCSVGNDQPPEGVTTEYSYSVINLSRLVGRLNGVLSRLLGLIRIKVKRNYFYLLFCIPDQFWGWIPLTTLKGLKLIKYHKIDMIYVSCMPLSSGVSALLLKFMTGKPLILDFRDPFGIERVFSILDVPKFRRKIERSLLKLFLKYTDIFIVNNDETRKIYIQEYPEAKDKIFSVHNGFESGYMIQKGMEKYRKFTIVYTGEFYFYALEAETFFQAIALLKQKGKISQDTFQFLFYGDGKSEIERIAKKYDITDLVITSSRVPYKAVLEVMSKSHLQLLRIVKPMISTKLFEGIPLNIPFLATIPHGEVEEIIHTYSPSSFVVTEESPEKISEAILGAVAKYENNEIKDNYVEEFLKRFSRESLTLELIKIIENHLNSRGPCVENN